MIAESGRANPGRNEDRRRRIRGPLIATVPRCTRGAVGRARGAQLESHHHDRRRSPERPAEDGETVLDAALRNGVGFAYSCQAGNCGTCKCEYVSGEIFELEYSEHALSAAERARNVVLACRTQVWSDVQIRRLSAEEFVVHPSRVMQCRVTDAHPAHP